MGLPAVNCPVLLDYSEQLAILLFGQLMKWLRPMVRRGGGALGDAGADEGVQGFGRAVGDRRQTSTTRCVADDHWYPPNSAETIGRSW